MNHDNDAGIPIEQTIFTLAVQIDRLREQLAVLNERVDKLADLVNDVDLTVFRLGQINE